MLVTYDREVLKQEAQLAATRKEFVTVPAEVVLHLISEAEDALANLSDARADIKDLNDECQSLTEMMADKDGQGDLFQ